MKKPRYDAILKFPKKLLNSELSRSDEIPWNYNTNRNNM